MALLEIRELEAGYGRLPVLHRVSLDVNVGEMVGILGPNGSGKSTLIKAIFRLLPSMRGSVTFDGMSLDGYRPEQVASLGMSVVPQVASVFPDLTVEDNLRIGRLAAGASSEEAFGRSYEAFPILKAKADARAKTLSGGERQMLAVASALASSPKFLALDEPTNGLGPKVAQELIARIQAVRESGTTVVWVVGEHAMDVLESLDRAYLLQEGVIKRAWSGDELGELHGLTDLIFGARASAGRAVAS